MSKFDKLKSVTSSPIPYMVTTGILAYLLSTGSCSTESKPKIESKEKGTRSLVISPNCTVENSCVFATDGGQIYSSKEAIKFENTKQPQSTKQTTTGKTINQNQSTDFCTKLVEKSEEFTTFDMQKQLFKSCNEKKDMEVTINDGFNQYCKSVINPVEAVADIKNKIYVICFKTFK